MVEDAELLIFGVFVGADECWKISWKGWGMKGCGWFAALSPATMA
jgi:hypothetical protein